MEPAASAEDPGSQPRPRAPDADELAAYARDGYLAWGRVLGEGEVAELRGEYDRVLAEAAGACRDIAAGGEAPRRMLQLMGVNERSLRFRRLLHDERLLAVVRAILGGNVLLFHDQALFKPPRCGGAVSWHQDNGYWRCQPEDLMSCWLALDDVDADNGAMQVVPGSHLAPTPHAASADGAALLAAPEPDPARVRVVALPAGACLFHHCRTLHYTAPNATDRPRRAFVIHYMAAGTRGADGEPMRAGWERPVLSLAM